MDTPAPSTDHPPGAGTGRRATFRAVESGSVLGDTPALKVARLPPGVTLRTLDGHDVSVFSNVKASTRAEGLMLHRCPVRLSTKDVQSHFHDGFQAKALHAVTKGHSSVPVSLRTGASRWHGSGTDLA